MKSKVPLSNYADILMGQSPKGETCNNDMLGIPLLNGPTEFGSKYPTPTQYTTDPKRISKINDILFCVRGSTTGRMNYADQEYAIGRGIAAISGKNGYPTVFVRGLIEKNLQHLLNIATGSTFPNVNKDMINSFEVENVSKEDAIKIAHILSTLDDKIELNRKMNQTLEAMAQALFKSWFVDFDPVYAKVGFESDEELEAAAKELGISKEVLELFPREFMESEMGMIPLGWEAQSLGDICSIITKGTTPKKSDIQHATDEVTIPFIKVKDIAGTGEINRDSLELIPNSVHTGSIKRSILEEDDLLFSIAGTIGRVAVVDSDLDNANTNQAIGIVRLKDKSQYLNLIWLALQSNGVQKNIISKVVQGVQANTSLKNLRDIPTLMPTEAVLNQWNDVVGGIINRIRNNRVESRTLMLARNTLLPKLLSGELDVSKVEV